MIPVPGKGLQPNKPLQRTTTAEPYRQLALTQTMRRQQPRLVMFFDVDGVLLDNERNNLEWKCLSGHPCEPATAHRLSAAGVSLCQMQTAA